MTATTAAPATAEPARMRTRLWNLVVAAWAAITGIAPHVLHHVGPLAGTALVAGAGGRWLFGAIGFVATIPMLLRLHKRFGTWVAPAIALAIFGAVFSFSTFVIGPRISAATSPEPAPAATELDEHGHPIGTQQ